MDIGQVVSAELTRRLATVGGVRLRDLVGDVQLLVRRFHRELRVRQLNVRYGRGQLLQRVLLADLKFDRTGAAAGRVGRELRVGDRLPLAVQDLKAEAAALEAPARVVRVD